VSARAWAIVEILLQAGLRASELCGLRHSSLVSTERYLHLLRETMWAELETFRTNPQ
jgi:site-specific recombinase XerC